MSTPASAGVTSFLRKQELAPRQRGYGGQRAAKKAASSLTAETAEVAEKTLLSLNLRALSVLCG